MNINQSSSNTQQQKPALLQFIITTAFIVIFFAFTTFPSWQALWGLWVGNSSGYSHGPLIIGICIWLLYECWNQLQTPIINKAQYQIALFFGVSASIIWALGYLTGIATLYWISLPIMATGIIVAGSKQQIKAAALAPGVTLIFAMPLWELLVPPLQSIAVTVVSITLRFLNLPAYIQGIEVNIPSGQFIIEGGCSGMRYLLVSLALASLWSFLHLRKTSHRITLICFSIAISIASNWVRILIIILIGYKTQMKSSIIYDHEYFGWIIFTITLIPICSLALWLEQRSRKIPAPQSHQPQSHQPQSHQPQSYQPQWQKRKCTIYLIAIAIIPILSQLYVMSLAYTPPPILKASIQTPLLTQPQTQVQHIHNINTGQQHIIFGGWKPHFPGVDSWHSYQYKPSNLEILIGHIAKQNQQQELLSTSNSFSPLNPSIQWSQIQKGNSIQLRNIYGQQWTTRFFYRIGGDFAAAGLKGKLQQFKQTLFGRIDGQLIVVGLPCQTNCESEQTSLDQLRHKDIQHWFRLKI